MSEPTGKAVREIVGYHVTGPEDDHLASAGEPYGSLTLQGLVQAAGGESVQWEVLTARSNNARYFDDARKVPLPPVRRFRITLEIFGEDS